MSLSQSQIVSIQHVQAVKILNLASSVVLAYDYLLTLKLEIDYAWHRQWSLVQVLFFITRYFPFVDVGISIYSQFIPGLSDITCRITYQFSGWSFTVGTAIAEVILAIRTWSLCSRDRKLGIVLIVFFVSCWAVIFLTMGIFLASSKVADIPASAFATCFFSAGDKLYVSWCVLMVYDAGIMMLMVVQAISIYSEGSSSPLLNVLYIEGISYYIFLFILSVMNVVVILTLPKDFVNLFTTLERVFHSILTCRVILHVREQAAKSSSSTGSFIDRNADLLKTPHPGETPFQWSGAGV